MPKKIDLTGKKFGKLTVVKEDGYIVRGKRKCIAWICTCDCGNTVRLTGAALTSGNTKSCGCYIQDLATSKIRDLTGQKFGNLIVTGLASDKKSNRVSWNCICNCGNNTVVTSTNLVNGRVISCGCERSKNLSQRCTVHGKSHTRLYRVWLGMRERCYNPHHISYQYYGARGIIVCQEWDDYLTFENWALSHGYDTSASRGECTLDRIDVDGNYEPANCRWVPMREQNINRRYF